MNITKTFLKDLVYRVNGAAIEVHKSPGTGLLESVYHKCLKEELRYRKSSFVSEKKVQILYKNLEITTELRCDLAVENILAVEIKSLGSIHPVHQAQILGYMSLLQVPIGLLLNFHVVNIFKEGQQTYVNEQYRLLPD